MIWVPFFVFSHIIHLMGFRWNYGIGCGVSQCVVELLQVLFWKTVILWKQLGPKEAFSYSDWNEFDLHDFDGIGHESSRLWNDGRTSHYSYGFACDFGCGILRHGHTIFGD